MITNFNFFELTVTFFFFPFFFFFCCCRGRGGGLYQCTRYPVNEIEFIGDALSVGDLHMVGMTVYGALLAGRYA